MLSDTHSSWVRVLLLDGAPKGLRLAEVSNWDGVGIVFPRSEFAKAHKRHDLSGTGIYVLVGDSGRPQFPLVYVGEAQDIAYRLNTHDKKKEFWTHCAAFVSNSHDLNKAHAKHLEARLVALAKQAQRCDLENSNTPKSQKLSEADRAYAEGFLTHVLLCLPIVGIDVFGVSEADPSAAGGLLLDGKGVQARGLQVSEGLLVRAGSTAVKEETQAIPESVSTMRGALIEKGVLASDGDRYTLAQDYTFSSPSMAAGVILGGSVNGLTAWKDDTGKTLKQLLNE